MMQIRQSTPRPKLDRRNEHKECLDLLGSLHSSTAFRPIVVENLSTNSCDIYFRQLPPP